MSQKGFKGMGMEGGVARWYARTRQKDIHEFRRQAASVAARLRSGAAVLEVAPGPGFFSIELAKLGNFQITGLDVSHTFVRIAAENAQNAKVDIAFRQGNASEMPFPGNSFDFIYCSAAFKNFSEPVQALDEMCRVLRPSGEAWIADLRKDASPDEVNSYVTDSGRNWFDAWMTKWTFKHVLLKRAYTSDDFRCMAGQSRFGACKISVSPISLQVEFTKAPELAVAAS